MSYRKKHIKNKIYGRKPGRSIFKSPIFWLALLFLIIAFSILYLLVFYPEFQVGNVIISGNDKTQEQVIEDIVLDSISKRFLSIGGWSLTSKSIFFINADRLNKQILDKLPIIESIKIDKKLPDTLILGITERKPAAVFCPFMDQPTVENQKKCFLIDGNGVIFEPLSAPAPDMVVVQQLMAENQVFTGEEVIARNIMGSIYEIEKSLKENFEIDIEEALITSPIQLNINTSENWKIYFNTDQGFNIGLQVAKLNLLLKGEIAPEARKNLQYIDLRFKDRAYYK